MRATGRSAAADGVPLGRGGETPLWVGRLARLWVGAAVMVDVVLTAVVLVVVGAEPQGDLRSMGGGRR